MKKIHLSVIVPTLNEEKFVPSLLQDLSKQKEENFEVIVVDGKSEDNTKESVLAFSHKLNLRFFTVDKRNVSFQRNWGATHAQGEYLVFIDADSRIASTYLAKVHRYIDKTKRLVLIPEIFPTRVSVGDKMVYHFINSLVATSQHTNKPFSTGGFMVVQRNFFLHIGGFDEKCFLSEDHDLIQRARKAGVITLMMRGVKLKFSLRRLKREGRLDLFIKYLIGAILTLKSGGIQKKIFEYEMGGGHYAKPKETRTFNEYVTRYSKKLREYFDVLNGE